MSRACGTEAVFPSAESGFTLLEVLVALAIFALASAIAYSGLDSVASTKAVLEREIRFWRELGLVFDRMEADFMQSIPHPLHDAPDVLGPPLRGANLDGGDDRSYGFFIDMIRQDENLARVRVRYLCEQGSLTLRVSGANPFVVAGGSERVRVIDTPLLHAVERCDVAFLSAANAWLDEWPGDQALARPRAIRIRLSLGGQGTFERLFNLP